MTTVFNLYGGPGCGKSTMAAYLFYLLKTNRGNAELVREYVKEWAWEKRNISSYDQMYIAGKHIRKESLLLGKVDYIVTDYPVLMSTFYANKFAGYDIAFGVEEMVYRYYQKTRKEGHTHIHVLLTRSFEYDPKGRYQNEEEAKQMDSDITTLVRKFTSGDYRVADPTESSMKQLLWGV